MPIRNPHWYNRNEGTPYPLDSTASGLTTEGKLLESNILVDANLRWPEELGSYAFVGGITVTPQLVTLTLQAAYTLTSTQFIPLAVVSVPAPIYEGKLYAVQPQSPGVGGWVVFGSGAIRDTLYVARFALPKDSWLSPKAARSYRALPVSGLGVLHQDHLLRGVVQLRAEAPLSITKEQRVIEGVLRDCVVVRLKDDSPAAAYPVPSAIQALKGKKEPSILQQFAGPCAGRPESQTCGDPQPIEFINSVGPDCDGVLTLEFTGQIQAAQLTPDCGIVLDHPLGLTDSCLPPQIPDNDGKLPGEYDPYNITPPGPPTVPPLVYSSESFSDVLALPYHNCFTEGFGDVAAVQGNWIHHTNDDSPTAVCPEDLYFVSQSLSDSLSDSSSLIVLSRKGVIETTSRTLTNIALWQGFDVQTTYRRVVTEVKLLPILNPTQERAGLVLNYRAHPTISGRVVYYAVLLDRRTQQLVIARWNGFNFVYVVPIAIPAIRRNRWYRLEAQIRPTTPPGTTIRAILTNPVTDAVLVDTQVTVNNYRPSLGLFGLVADQTFARFAYLSVEEFV